MLSFLSVGQFHSARQASCYVRLRVDCFTYAPLDLTEVSVNMSQLDKPAVMLACS